MNSDDGSKDHTKYTDQPDRMPAEVRAAIEDAWGGRPVQLYALTDLDAGMRFTEVWLALGESEVALARRDGGSWEVRSIPRARLVAIAETPGLSGSNLTLMGAPDEPALAVLRYTHRQRRAVENVRFVLEQELGGSRRFLRPTRMRSTPGASRHPFGRPRHWWPGTRPRCSIGCWVT